MGVFSFFLLFFFSTAWNKDVMAGAAAILADEVSRGGEIEAAWALDDTELQPTCYFKTSFM